MISSILKGTYADLALMEKELAASGLDWTVLWPPRLGNGPRTGTYRTVVGANVRNARIISRADVAHCMLAALSSPDTIGQPIGIAR